MKRPRGPLTWLGPEAAKTGRALARRTRLLLMLSIVLANIVGAVIVFVFANFVVPTPELTNQREIRLVNLLAFALYLGGAVVIGAFWGTKRMRSLRDFLEEERDPTRDERREVLLGPLRLTLVNAVLWFVAVFVFGAINLSYDPQLGLAVAITVALGGITTTAFAYLLSERVLRAAVARVMMARPPKRPVVPGVAARSVLAWSLGTAVPLMGLVIVAIYTLGGDDIDGNELARTVVALGGISLVFGLLAIILAARAAADPITSVRRAINEVEGGDFDVEVPVYDASELGLLQAGFNRMVGGLRERERIREAFGTYVDRDVAEHILEEGTMEGEEVEVTLVFLDVRDFTGFAERSPAREVVATLNRMFEIAVPIVREHGGHVDKFVGDGLLAVFGAPRPASDHAERALRAAMQIASEVEKEFGDDLEIGIGINSGTVVAGSIGGGGRLEFSVIGDAVNVAARIEAATRDTGDTILLSEASREMLDGTYELKPRTDVELKGKRGKATLYAP